MCYCVSTAFSRWVLRQYWDSVLRRYWHSVLRQYWHPVLNIKLSSRSRCLELLDLESRRGEKFLVMSRGGEMSHFSNETKYMSRLDEFPSRWCRLDDITSPRTRRFDWWKSAQQMEWKMPRARALYLTVVSWALFQCGKLSELFFRETVNYHFAEFQLP